MDTENLISTLIKQHRELQKKIGLVLDFSLKIDYDAAKILQALAAFKNNLGEHLKLENDIFYVELIKKMKAKNLDIAKTELFIKEMDDIANAVTIFLDSYTETAAISQKIDELRQTLPNIINTLNLRIESEESGVYAYWAAL